MKTRIWEILAADKVRLWATEAGFVVNESLRDRKGWDHYYEFSAPPSNEPKIPPGMPSGALSCKIQVKATAGRAKVARIKLSNLLVFCQEPIPCFIAFLKFERKSTEPKDVYLIHVGEEVIGRVLERICKLTLNERQYLHRYTLSLPLQMKDRLTEPWSEFLRERITSLTGANLLEYAQRKQKLYDTVGFGEHTVEFQVTFQAPSAAELYERMSMMAVGLESMEFVQLEESRRRFGIAFPLQKIDPEHHGLIEVRPTASDRAWSLRVFEHDLSNPLEFRCMIRSAGRAFPFLPDQYWLVRIQTSMLDILARNAQNQISFTYTVPPIDEPIPFDEWFNTCKFLERVSSTAGNKIVLRITKDEMDGKSFDFSISSPGVSIHAVTRQLNKIVSATGLVVRHLGLDFNTSLSLAELNAIYPEIFLLESLAVGMVVQFKFTVTEKVARSGKSAIVTILGLKFGRRQYFFALAVLGVPVIGESEHSGICVSMESKEIRLLQRWAFRPEEVNTFSIEAAEKNAERILNEEGIENVFFVRWAEIRTGGYPDGTLLKG